LLYRIGLSDDDCLDVDLPALTFQHFTQSFTMHTERLALLDSRHRLIIVCKNYEEAIQPEVALVQVDQEDSAPAVVQGEKEFAQAGMAMRVTCDSLS
jgi:hypothetical protein